MPSQVWREWAWAMERASEAVNFLTDRNKTVKRATIKMRGLYDYSVVLKLDKPLRTMQEYGGHGGVVTIRSGERDYIMASPLGLMAAVSKALYTDKRAEETLGELGRKVVDV